MLTIAIRLLPLVLDHLVALGFETDIQLIDTVLLYYPDSIQISVHKTKILGAQMAVDYRWGRPHSLMINSKAIPLTTIASLATSSFLIIGGTGIQSAEILAA